jgi:hypothetical protein
MNLPGFTAEASVYVAAHRCTAVEMSKSGAAQQQVIPQFRVVAMLPPGIPPDFWRDIPVGSGARLPATESFCNWNLFCWLDKKDKACRQRWLQHCVPE